MSLSPAASFQVWDQFSQGYFVGGKMRAPSGFHKTHHFLSSLTWLMDICRNKAPKELCVLCLGIGWIHQILPAELKSEEKLSSCGVLTLLWLLHLSPLCWDVIHLYEASSWMAMRIIRSWTSLEPGMAQTCGVSLKHLPAGGAAESVSPGFMHTSVTVWVCVLLW